jgi:hypothetical protein
MIIRINAKRSQSSAVRFLEFGVSSSILKMEAVGSSETLVTTYKTTRSHSPEDHAQRFHHSENFQFHKPI